MDFVIWINCVESALDGERTGHFSLPPATQIHFQTPPGTVSSVEYYYTAAFWI